MVMTPFSRRRFLQVGAAGTGGLWLASSPLLSQLRAFAAPPVGANQGILVVVMMDGGNDGLNTLVPVSYGRYYDVRPNLAIPEANALAIGDGRFALHPSLTNLRRRYNAGKVAIVRGVGYASPDLSHFESMDIWSRGWGGAGYPMTGWLGRWLDELPGSMSESLYAVTIGGSVPMHLAGMHARPAGLPVDISGAFGMEREDISDRRMYNAFKRYGNDPSGLGEWGDAFGDAAEQLMDLTVKVGPAYGHHGGPDTHLGHQLSLCAHLINANLGIRLLDAHIGGFDTHAGQPAAHADLLNELDDAIEAFFDALDPAWRGRVTLMTFSEFGRRPESNDDAGTDHGTASTVFVVGDHVNGGLHGEQPSLLDLDDNGNLKRHVDFRQVYATILDKWLKADEREVLGKTYSQLDLFASGPSGGGTTAPPGDGGHGGHDPDVPLPPGVVREGGYWIAGPNGELAAFGSAPTFPGLSNLNLPVLGGAATPSGRGLWLCASDGGIFAFGDAQFYGSTGGITLNRPVVGMAATPSGHGYWLVATDGGIFAFGDAGFFGSTGAMTLNKPVVTMAATPSGHGYWLCASDGGMFSFGDAQFLGSTGGITLNQPIVAMAATPAGDGYWLCAADGGIFAFGNAMFHGSAAGSGETIRDIASTASGHGYWMVSDNGRVFAFGDAADFGRANAPTSVIVPSTA